MKSDTIAAIATAMSDSGIGIVRVSGDESISIVNKIFQTKNEEHILSDVKSHTIHYGFIYDRNELIDEVLVAVMKAPNTYTAEDTVEIDCHGGILVLNRVLQAVLDHGARIAEPGEFTKCAFLNGRIDLSKAEAVMDVINAKNQYALTSSMNQLKGSLYDKICSMREKIIHETAYIESALDDPEHYSLEGYAYNLKVKVSELMESIQHMLDTAEDGRIIKEGINTVILGKPNAGKSSLLNCLSGREKAIVTSVPGTTRDVLEESIRLNGILFNITDTAGICKTDDEVEKIGIVKAKQYARDADLIIYVVDSSHPLDEMDEDIISLIADKKKIILLNKNDLESVVTEQIIQERVEEAADNSLIIIKTSTKEGLGIDLLENAARNMFFEGAISCNDQVFITNMRHKEYLKEGLHSLELVDKSIEDGMEEDFYSIDLLNAYISLGHIIGEEVKEDLVNEIFSKFCMGK